MLTDPFRRFQIALVLGVLAFLLYAPAVTFDFINFDDYRIVLSHPELYSGPDFWSCLRAILVDQFPREEPLLLRDISWLVDATLFGFDNPLGYHLMNVVYHAIVVALLFVFLDLTTGNRWLSILSSLVFMALAVHVEPVAWIMGRKDILSSLFMLAALISQTKGLLCTPGTHRELWVLATILWTLAALLSKINAVFFPVVLLAHAVFFPWIRDPGKAASPRAWWHRLKQQGVGFVPHFFFAFVVFLWYRGVLDRFGLFQRGYDADWWQHLIRWLTLNPLVFLSYAKDLVLPSHLSLVYAWPHTDLALQPHHAAIAVTFFGTVATAGIWLFLRRKDLFFFYLSFWVMMIPYTNIIYIGIWRANRYLYFSSAFLVALLIGLLFPKSGSASRLRFRVGIVLVGLVIAVNAVQKIRYLDKWQDSQHLWTYEKSLNQGSLTPFHNLVEVYLNRARVEKDPNARKELLNKAESVAQEGIDAVWRDTTRDPPPSLYKLFFSKALIAAQRSAPVSESLKLLRLVIRLNPNFPQAHLKLAALTFKMAKEAQDPAQRKHLAQVSWNHFRNYTNTADHGRHTQNEIQGIRADYLREFPFLESSQQVLP